MLLFLFVIMSHKLGIGPIAAVAAFALALFEKHRFTIPGFYRWYIAYFVWACAGLVASRYQSMVSTALSNFFSVIIVGITLLNIIHSRRDVRSFTFGFIGLFVLFPMRGAFYNYLHGITDQGRIAWNFFFSNPNDLAIACVLPLGLCAYGMLTERGMIKRLAQAGAVAIFVVQLLTQSRGALIGDGVALLYFILRTPRRVRTLVIIVVMGSIAAAVAPSAVWHRLGGLKNASLTDMSAVDPEGSASGRWALMNVAAEIAMDNPLTGVGVGAYPVAHAVAALHHPELGHDERGARDAHCMYIRSAAETGLAGGIFILCFAVSGLRASQKMRRSAEADGLGAETRLALVALEASVVAYLVAAIFNSAERSTFTALQFTIPYVIARCHARIAAGEAGRIAQAMATTGRPAAGHPSTAS